MKLKNILINILFVVALLVPVISTDIVHAQPLKKHTATIPAMDPYCGDGGYLETALNIEGAKDECDAITNPAIPDDVSDWVLVELRAVADGVGVDATTAGTVVARTAAFLLQNGYVVDANKYTGAEAKCPVFSADECPLVEFSFEDAVLEGMDLYVVVRHINHLDIISSEAVTTETVATRYEYDFTDAPTRAKGGSLALKKIGENAAMYVGDVNGDTNVNAADYLQIYDNMNSNVSYSQSDIDFDGKVDDADAASSRLRENLGRAVQLP